MITLKVTKKTGKVAAAQIVDDGREVYVLSEKAQVLRTSLSEIRSIGRVTQGVSIFKPDPGDRVASIACVSLEQQPERQKQQPERQKEEPAAPAAAPSSNGSNGKGNGQIPLKGF